MTDQQLKLALAKMLPERVMPADASPTGFFFKRDDGCFHYLYEEGWLHVCWLVEQALTDAEFVLYTQLLTPDWRDWMKNADSGLVLGWRLLASATWQKRALALSDLLGVKP